MKQRKAKIDRKTKETQVSIDINLDKPGSAKIDTSIPFMDHMLNLFASQAKIGLKIRAWGDTKIDDHHLVEDLGITLGLAIKKAVGDKKKISRYGNFLLPMDEALSYVAVDLSGRPYLDYDVKFNLIRVSFDFDLIEDFFYALCVNSGMTLHISLKKGRNNHHIAESIFKGFGRAFGYAVKIDARQKGIPSTKGKL